MSRGWVEEWRDARDEADKDMVEGRRLLVKLLFAPGEVGACFPATLKLSFMKVRVPVGEAVGVLDEVTGPLKVLKVPQVLGGRTSYLVVDVGGDEAVGRRCGDMSAWLGSRTADMSIVRFWFLCAGEDDDGRSLSFLSDSRLPLTSTKGEA